ncbi:rho family-interacting cell polarization regulator 1 isoform X4 [Salmo salar]|nr:rho family-interacting cell polarization regulator 1 isoform X4 [Salmo salar]XP_014004540.1 rho family-interacting cell polarization regulator 1 isoform X4 [Salmo salar]XP_014004541.1 rho family-interacting cell polarization regulator 1 isoform X4 [Salmo salar]XP_014004542.1 rho family-interacting cell polarization regulator 1 isoform X4 [Salmo salar]XP_045553115.1 rho family-interacting cell polarization regulator 1 isoform X4 [Salmo salar]|eukprot:XP_014004534.1 PREDICTED: protein FAM65A isoform X1 [Salmo salar]
MSLSVRPSRRVISRSITRSQSFAGVNSHDKPYRNLSVFSTPRVTRKPSRASRMFTLSAKSPPPKVPQPERLDEVYEALKRGLQSYLQVHQIELDSLSRQMRESKRNSRLGFLYELDKQVKVVERFMRRLEFHLSKIDELYEAYCMQHRLRDGANKMVKAYTVSQGSREARESLSEANKGYKEYTENMCMLESELENQLGEFHVKMKGLAGFARLCAGDTYEIFMKYGRQRWKLRGRMEINGKQVWDSEDMVFLPLITEFLSIKVTELKSLANHVVVGNVSCETKDLFAALPRTVAVDINDLGTIKLSLEVTWNPFDKDDQASAASTVNKPPTVNKRFSTYNQSPPDTPSLREQAFYNMLRRQEEMENGTAWSNSSESSDDSSSPQLSLGLRHANKNLVQLEVQAAAPSIEISFAPRDSATSTPTRSAKPEDVQKEEPDTGTAGKEEDSGKQAVPNGQTRYSRSLSHISENSVDGVLMDRSTCESVEPSEATSLQSGISINDIEMEMPARAESAPVPAETVVVGEPSEPLAPATVTVVESRPESRYSAVSVESDTGLEVVSGAVSEVEPELQSSAPARTDAVSLQGASLDLRADSQAQTQSTEEISYTAHRAVVVEAEKPGPVVEASPTEGEKQQAVDSEVEEALSAVIASLDDYRGQFPELQVLEQELRLLEETLTGHTCSCSSSVQSLAVETALGSFDFLNTSDLEDEDEEEDGEKRSVTDSERHSAPGRPPEESAGEDECCEERCWESHSSGPVSTGCQALDHTLLVHLKNCSAQLLRLGTFGPLRCGEMYALDRLLREARVLELIRRVAKETPGGATQPDEVVPQLEQCQGATLLWQQCTNDGSVYSTSTDAFLTTLAAAYTNRLPERGVSLADTVFLRLAERILERRLPKRGGGVARDMLTLFQFWSYLEAEGVSELDTHIIELAEEVWLVQSLQSGDQEVLVKALKRPPESSLKREGLHAVSLLLRDPRGKVSASASSLLRSLADQPRHRERALVSCLELLENESVETRVCGCKALACLKAKESIDQLVYLCRSDKEDVRDAAKQALLVLGEEGKLAHRHVEISLQEGVPRLFSPGSMASTAF